jgi:DNA-directed RNA polymerase subunit RPC12/RpoP
VAIHHLLYACVECGREAGIRETKDGEVCERCGARYSRAEGAGIRCEPNNGPPVVKHPAEWLDILARGGVLERPPSRPEPVLVRMAHGSKPYRHSGIYLGEVEYFGDPVPGLLELTTDALVFTPSQGPAVTWSLNELTAVQPSSTTLQLKIRHGPVVSLRFPEGSPLLWEERVRNAVQATFTRAGKGEIAEFQPRIVCR